MTMGDTAIEPAKLSFGATFGGAFSAVFSQFWMFIKAAIVPFVLGILVAIIGGVIVSSVPELTVVWQVLALIPLAILGIAYCRLVLLGRQAGAVPRPLFGRRTWVYFGYALLIAILTIIPFVAIVTFFIGSAFLSLGGDIQDPDIAMTRALGIIPTVFLVYVVVMYFVTRLSLVFPAVSVDQKLGLRGSWRLTRGSNGFKLYAALIVLSIVCAFAVMIIMFIVSSIFSFFLFLPGAVPSSPEEFDILAILLSSAPTLIIALALEYLVFALLIAALAGAYAHLSGWGGPREDILERFE